MIYIYLYVLYAHQSRTFFVPSKLNFQPQRNINNISYITICMYIAHTSSLSTAINLDFGGVQRIQIDFSSESNFQMYQFSLNLEFFRNTNLWFFLGQFQKIHVMGICAIKDCVRREMAVHQIYFFCQMATYIKLCVAFVFGLQRL